MYRYIFSLLIVAAAMLSATPAAQAGVYVELVDSITDLDYDYIPFDTSVTIKVKMDNDVGENVTYISNAVRIYSPQGATWQTPTFAAGDSLDVYFDFMQEPEGFDLDGSGDDTIGIQGWAFGTPGVPDGYEGLELMRIYIRVPTSGGGDTLCIDSVEYPPSGVWQWDTPTQSVTPGWGGPYCYAVGDPSCYANGDANNDGLGLSVSDLSYLIAYLSGNGPAPPVPYKVDLNGDGVIDAGDLQVYKDYFIYGLSVFAPYGGYPVACPCNPVLAPVAVYLHSVEGGGNRGPGEIVAGIPFVLNIGIGNHSESSVTDISSAFRVYSPDGAIWEPLAYGFHWSFPVESFFDVSAMGEFSNDGVGEDIVTVSAQATGASGLPAGYTGQEAIWLSTVVGASEVGRTICIDSSFHPPDFTWQWQMPSVEMTPVWDGPHCFEIVEYTWDTLYAHDGEYATYGTAQIALDGDSVSVANVGAGGNDGVTIGFEETAGVTVRFGEQGPIPMGTAVKGLKLVPFPEYCCAYDNYSGGGATPCIDQYPCPNGFSPLPDHTCAPGANNPHLYCAPLIAVENRVADRSVASGAGLSIFGGPNNESATIVPDGCDDPLGYTLYVYNNTVLVDTVVCDSGTTITTDNAMPTAMIFGDMIGLSYSSTMDFVVGGDVYIGDEIRSRPKSAQRSELISRIGIVGRGLVADPELASFSIIDIETASCCVVRGDFTHNGNVDISDLVSLVDFMFTGGPGPLCDEEADLNDDDGVDIADLVYFVEFMFNGGPTPVPCGQSAPINKLVGEVPDISFGIEYNGEASTVLMNSAIDLRGIQLELKGVGPAPENLVGDHVDMVHGRDGWVVRVGLLDLDGGQVVKSDVRQIIRLDGEYTLESVTVADEQARSIRPRIGPIAKHEGLPADYALGQNYPNPFNPSTSIGFALPEAAEVRLEVYNLLGQRVVSLINQRLEAGNHTVQWDSRNESGQAISSGVYFYRLETPRYTKSKKMILLK